MTLLIEDLRLTRPDGFVLDVPALGLPAGKVTALVGENGAGKSTLLRAIAGLERPRSGTIRFEGAPLRSQALAFAFQERVFLDGTVRENLDLALRIRRLPAAGRAARITAAAAELGIAHLLDREAARLSGGEQQRVNLARTLALRAPVTLLDEPLVSLDAEVRERLISELPASLRCFARVAVVVAHDRREALGMAEHIVILRAGRVLAAGDKAVLFARPPDAETARALGLVILARDQSRWAVLDHDLRLGQSDHAPVFELRVEQVLDLGTHAEVLGRCCGGVVVVRAALDAELPRPGATTSIVASHAVELPR